MSVDTSPTITAVVTTHNEGDELHRTLQSIRENTRAILEIIVIDDASDDGSCDSIADDLVRVIRHDQRIGVAWSRNEASKIGRGDVLCYLDAHHRIARGCLDRCATLAVERSAITCPDIRDFGLLGWRLHGANFRLCPKNGFFSAKWRQWFAIRRVSQITGLRAPPYLIPRALYSRVSWSPSLRGWGASEACVGVKAFFAGVPILHVAGPVARHQFRSRFHYETNWEGVWRNQAIIARICFDEATWFNYWLPKVFEPRLTDEVHAELESAAIQAEHEEFQRTKVRTDCQFWSDLLHRTPPEEL